MDKNFFQRFIIGIERLLLAGIKPLFVTFFLGNALVVMKFVEKPTYKEWCIGTAFLLIGGGAIKVGKGLQEKFISK